MYSNAKIYKLFSTQGNEIFIGATTQTLEQKMKFVKYEKNKNEIFRKYAKIEIELLLAYPCKNSSELKDKLNEYILNNNCINNNKFRNEDLNPITMLQKEKRKEHDTLIYYKDVEHSRRLKIIQKISREGTIPTQTSILKYNITITELLKIQEYLGNIKEHSVKEEYIKDKLIDRIAFITTHNR